MTFYPQSILDEIRDRVSIVSYIGEHLQLKKAGRNHKGLCPFHSEKTSSFIVSDEKEIFHCFGCGEGGNIFSFVMKYEGLTFTEAVESLAAREGVVLPKKNQSQGEKERDSQALQKKKLLFKINKFVAQYFRNNLEKNPQGKVAHNYLKSRGIFDDNSTQHFLGYAEDSWDALTRHLESKNVPLKFVEELGLIRRSQKKEGYYDFFRGRLIFPIISPRSEVLGFGGRILDDKDDKEAAKYLNSSDSMIYHKSHSVYGLNVAQGSIRKNDQVIVVEGYMDVLALFEAGILNVVAPLGTALTASQIRLIGRYTKNVVLIFDGDEAGVQAAERSLPSFMEVGVMPKVVLLPEGEDPDDWICSRSKEDFDQLIQNSNSLLDWYIKKKSLACSNDNSKKFQVVAELEPIFGQIKNSVEYRYYRRLLSDELKIEENDLLKSLSYEGKSEARSLKENQKGVTGRLRAEKLLISIMLGYPDFIEEVKNQIEGPTFTDESFRTIFELLVKESAVGRVSVGRLYDMVADEELKNSLHSLSIGDDVDSKNVKEMLDDCIKYLEKSRLSNRLKVITEEIKVAENSKDEDAILKLISEKSELLSRAL